MARFKYLTKDDIAPEHRQALGDINLSRLMINNPELARVSSTVAAFYPHQDEARSAAARNGDPAGRLFRPLAL